MNRSDKVDPVTGRITRPRVIPLIPSQYKDDFGHWKPEVVLATRAGRRRWMLGYIDERGVARREFGGPRLPGPYAYAFELATVLTANPAHSSGAEAMRNRAAGVEFDVEAGDMVRMGWDVFEIVIDPRGYVSLAHVETVDAGTLDIDADDPGKHVSEETAR